MGVAGMQLVLAVSGPPYVASVLTGAKVLAIERRHQARNASDKARLTADEA
jgi:hypothetical protein